MAPRSAGDVKSDEKTKQGAKGARADAPPPAAVSSFRKSTVREYFETLLTAVVLALFVRTWVVQAFKIPTGSMENNLLIGDHLLVNKFVFGPTASALERAVLPVRAVRRGDIVVFKYPEDPERDFIKRVIGLPGETIEVRRKVVHVGGRPLDESYVHFLQPAAASDSEVTAHDVRESYGPVTVPEGHYFVMGDNRDNSQDSRYWGFLPAGHVKGRALVIYWSWDAEGGANPLAHTRWGRLLRPIR